jgi:cephalosporin hydroxylase
VTPYQLLLDKLHRGKSPYDGFPNGWSNCWYGDPGAQREIFKTALDRARPGLVIEVGSFVGESAIFMAKHMKAKGMQGTILCVDTWYAGFDHYKGAPEKIQNHFGRPDFYYKFIANVIANDCQDIILPFAMDSKNAARVLHWMGIEADLIYIDASHEEGDVLEDYQFYWRILKSGGVFMVDDVSGHFEGVVRDWSKFVKEKNLTAWLIEGEKQAVIKP